MPSLNQRGRPRKDDPRDLVIAKTVDTLIGWGFSGDRQVFEMVGLIAHEVLGRGDSNGLALGPDMIKKVFIRDRAKLNWRGTIYPRYRFTKRSLQERIPNKTAAVEDLARVLLENHGEWPKDPTAPVIIHSDLELSPKGAKELEGMPRIVGHRIGTPDESEK